MQIGIRAYLWLYVDIEGSEILTLNIQAEYLHSRIA
jgi:hypothetical protein